MSWNGEQEKRSMSGEKDRETEAYLARIALARIRDSAAYEAILFL